MSQMTRRLSLAVILSCALAASAPAQAPGPRPALTAEQYLAEGHKAARERQFDKAVDAYRQAISPIYITRTEKSAGRLVNRVIDRIPAVSQEATWGWWNKDSHALVR